MKTTEKKRKRRKNTRSGPQRRRLRWGMKKDCSLYATARLVGAHERRRIGGGGRRVNR